MHDELGGAEVNLPATRLLDTSADLALHLRRCEVKPLVGPLSRHTEAAARPIAEIHQNRGSQCVDIQRRPTRIRKVCDAKRAADAFAHFFPRRARTQHDLDPPHQGTHGLHVKI